VTNQVFAKPALKAWHLYYRRCTVMILALFALMAVHLHSSSTLTIGEQWSIFTGGHQRSFEALAFHLSALPRLTMALLVGAAMGLSGSMLQQMTQNRLVSPMTVGASSGAWLGLVCATLWLPPEWGSAHSGWAALSGALLSVALVLLIAGKNGVAGLPIILAGMTVNLLFGALAAGITLINNQYTRELFVWGAGDLAQIDWKWVNWLWPKLVVGLLVILLAPRVLTLLQIGPDGARARGMNPWPVMLGLFLICIWLTAVSITAVGLIGFIGLLTPNFARLLGARTSRVELLFSTLLGAMLLVATDSVALYVSRWSGDFIPTGAAAALIGAPVLVWLSQRQISATDPRGQQWLTRNRRWNLWRLGWAMLFVISVFTVNICLARNLQGWVFAWPNDLIWSLRWPRMLTAAAAGCGLALAGMVLQRLLRNPLASPDILGLSAGATLAVMVALMLFGGSLLSFTAPIAAFIGSLLVLCILLLLGRRHTYSHIMVALVGISLTALLNAALQLILAKGNTDTFALLGWLAGSTYHASPIQAVALAAAVLILGCCTLMFHRALTLIAISDGVARSCGLNVTHIRIWLLALVSLLCAVVTSLLGPVSFLGLLAPHTAAIMGARRALQQGLAASALGTALMLLADWIGRTLIFPLQMPVGIVASIICGMYFVYLLVRRRLA